MEVFVRDLPTRANHKQVHEYFEPILEKLSIEDWQCARRHGNPYAKLTFLRHGEGQKFLSRYGHRQRKTPGQTQSLMFQGATLKCQLSKFPPEPFALKSLQMDAKARELVSAGKVDPVQDVPTQSLT